MTPDTFVTDGINKTYPASKVFQTGSTYLFLDGVYQGLGRDYTEDAGQQSITFVNLPAAGLEGELRYLLEEDISVAPAGSTFKEQLASDAVNIFLNDNEFAEEITYIPPTGSSRAIKAIVDRKRVIPAGEDTGRILLDQFEITIANDAINGLAVVRVGEDKFSLPEVLGGTSINWSVLDILGHDEGMWHLLLQK